ncbi:MAG: SH3 domain-containing protein [Anaerolineae bacterium]|nr:SH3 domain-containing protein [Anaerolineae bacterium]
MTPGTVLIVVDDPQGALNTLGARGWIQLRAPDGTVGWASARFLERL